MLHQAYAYATEYVDGVTDRPVFPREEALEALGGFDAPLPQEGLSGIEMLERLNRLGAPATTAQIGGRYFGFVNGGTHPPSMAARWLADSWDQNAALYAISPIASKLEEVCERRIAELLALPKGTAAGLLSGTSMSLVCGFAVARNRLLERQGGNVAADGSFHATVFKALSLPGLGPASM